MNTVQIMNIAGDCVKGRGTQRTNVKLEAGNEGATTARKSEVRTDTYLYTKYMLISIC